MADECASPSAEDTDSRKRKIVSTSESGNSVFSPPTKRYKLRATTIPTCVFGGKSLSETERSTSGSSCSVRGPATSYWGPTQTNRLNFKKPVPLIIRASESWEHNILRVLFEPSKGPDSTVLPGPEIVTTAVKEKVLEACTGSPVQAYIMEVINGLIKTGLPLQKPSKEDITSMQAYLKNKIDKDERSKKYNIPVIIFGLLKEFFFQALWLCCIDKKQEGFIDELIMSVMQIINLQDDPHNNWFRIRGCNRSKVKFDICGASVTSITNIIWETGNKGSTLPDQLIPIVLSENKGSFSEGENEGKQTAQHPPKKKSFHMKIPQVIGQCVSMADKSIFETKDYKIVYHVSLMSIAQLVITRTHVAKSTLKVIKDGCPIPDQNDLDPSYVFEAPFYIHNDIKELTVSLYTALQIFGKLANMVVRDKPGAVAEATSH